MEIQYAQPHKEKPDSLTAWIIITIEIVLTAFALFLSSSDNVFLWIAGQILFAVEILHWFILFHDFGHGIFFKSPLTNIIFGHVVSVFTLIPFYPWKHTHHSHHVWTGWKDMDPTQPEMENMKPLMIKVMNFCWKYWIPVFCISFSLQKYWNITKLNQIYKSREIRLQNIFSIISLLIINLTLILLLQGLLFQIWLPAFILYLIIADPLLISQHTHIDQNEAGGKSVKVYSYKDQSIFTRTLVCPKWVSRFIFYNFEKHGLHHQFPSIPLYKLGKYEIPEENRIGWIDWVMKARKIPGNVLMFQTHRQTGIKL